ncbi:NADH dehydrogenase [ubiquinone] 1 alpha subcomplex assembly factor 7, partial [Phenoliferia sp. Uapishka_3]
MFASLRTATTRKIVLDAARTARVTRVDRRGILLPPGSSAARQPIQSPTSGKAASVAPVPTELLTVIEETIKVCNIVIQDLRGKADLASLSQTHGPLPVSRYMTLCLQHPTLGYYTTKKVFGSVGDFITSPEISQIFGELLAIWYVTQWAAQGAASKVRIVELGPGRGTLLADILRTFKALPSHSSPPVTSIHLIESSDAMRAEQKKKLEATGFAGVTTHWWGSVDEVPTTEDEFTIIVAHEFFDALPIHVFENTPKGWREVMVDVSDPKSIIVSSAPKLPLRLVLSPSPTPASTMYTRMATIASDAEAAKPSLSAALSFDTTLPPPTPTTATAPATPEAPVSQTLSRFARLPVGSRMEISPACWEVARGVGKLLQGQKGGAGLVVDYGDEKAFGRSWRGFRKHQIVDPLSEPGHTDLTANVDFSYLAEAMSDMVTSHGPLQQKDFLTSLGLQPRLEGLLRKAKDDRRGEIESAAKRLVDKAGMGSEYKVMAITPKKEGEGERAECFPFGTKRVGE